MKLKLTTLLFFVSLGLMAQKQLQPYNYSITDNGKTQTILIYASAEAVNSITFTLKNSKNEVLKNDKNEEIKFKVFPFTEVSFRAKLNEVILSLNKSEKDKKESFNLFTEKFLKLNNPSERGVVVKNVRNIYQFFNALVITAFQYDNEPVAGVLKYKDSVIIIKNNIEGQDTGIYFKRRAKLIRKTIIDAKGDRNIFLDSISKGKYKDDRFLKFLSKNPKIESEPINESGETSLNNSYLTKLFEFYQNIKKRDVNNSKSVLKKHIKKNLKDWYNIYELSLFINKGFVMSYFDHINKIRLYGIDIKAFDKKIDSSQDDIIKNTTEIEQNNEMLINSFILPNNEEALTKYIIFLELERINLIALNQKNPLTNFTSILFSAEQEIKELNTIKVDNSELNSNNKKLNDDIKSFTKNIDSINSLVSAEQNRINFLIASNKDKIATVPLWIFKVDNIELDLNDGFIEHITVTGKVVFPDIDKIAILNTLNEKSREKYKDADLEIIVKKFYDEPYVKEILKHILDKEFKFENEHPIGFSSKTDFADLDDYNLYAFEGSEKVFSLPLTNVINLYVQRHQNDRLDFSPRDQVVKLPLHDEDKNYEVELKKESSSKILSAKVFSDFNGLKEREPNGLVQIEVEKQIPLWTRRMKLGLGRSSNIGFFNYAKFNLTWAKLAEEDRELQALFAPRLINEEPKVDKFVTYLDLVSYESTSVGIDINITSIDFPLIKTRFEINAGIHYGRVNIVDDVFDNPTDTIAKRVLDKKVNMIRAYPDIIARFRPDERFGVYLRFRPFRVIVPDNEEFYTVNSSKKFKAGKKLNQDWLHRFELGSYFTPAIDSDNKFFFRYRYTNTSTWETNGYSEFQVGYLMYLRF